MKEYIDRVNSKTYSAELTAPKTKTDGLQNFVQMIINQLEDGDPKEALLTAVDLVDAIESGIYHCN